MLKKTLLIKNSRRKPRFDNSRMSSLRIFPWLLIFSELMRSLCRGLFFFPARPVIFFSDFLLLKKPQIRYLWATFECFLMKFLHFSEIIHLEWGVFSGKYRFFFWKVLKRCFVQVYSAKKTFLQCISWKKIFEVFDFCSLKCTNFWWRQPDSL